LNIGEGGLGLSAAFAVTAPQLSNVRFRLPDSQDYWIETGARVAWTSPTQREAGLQFIELKPADQLRIRAWIASRLIATGVDLQFPADTKPAPAAGPPTAAASNMESQPLPSQPVVVPIQAATTVANIPVNTPELSDPAPEPQHVAAAPATPVQSAAAQAGKAQTAPPAAQFTTLPENPAPAARTASVIPPVEPAAPAQMPTMPVNIPADDSPRGWAVLEYGGEQAYSYIPPERPSLNWLKPVGMIAAIAIISFAFGLTIGRNIWRNVSDLLSPGTATVKTESDTDGRLAPPPPAGVYTNPRNAQNSTPAVAPTPLPQSASNGAHPPVSQTQRPGSDPVEDSYSSPLSRRSPESQTRSSTTAADPPRMTANRSETPAEPRASAATATPSPVPAPSAPPANAVPASPNPPAPATASPTASAATPSAAATAPVSAPPPAPAPVAADPAPAPVPAPAESAPARSAPTVHTDVFPSMTGAPSATGTVQVISNPTPSPRVPGSEAQPTAAPRNPQPSEVQVGSVISRVEPVYPAEASRQRVEGAVRLHVIVGKDGSVVRCELISGPLLLATAARNAVQQWRFKQTLLNGQPIESEENITIVFRLAHPPAAAR
jgi:TonB family protein